MRNYINLDLAVTRALSDERIRELNTLHSIMNAVVNQTRVLTAVDKLSQESYYEARECILYLEFLMQEAWGFPLDPNRHTHYHRIAGCAPWL